LIPLLPRDSTNPNEIPSIEASPESSDDKLSILQWVAGGSLLLGTVAVFYSLAWLTRFVNHPAWTKQPKEEK
jgi:hypothetical protein